MYVYVHVCVCVCVCVHVCVWCVCGVCMCVWTQRQVRMRWVDHFFHVDNFFPCLITQRQVRMRCEQREAEVRRLSTLLAAAELAKDSLLLQVYPNP